MLKQDLAERLDINPSTLTNICKGRQKLSFDVANRLSILTPYKTMQLMEMTPEDITQIVDCITNPRLANHKLMMETMRLQKSVNKKFESLIKKMAANDRYMDQAGFKQVAR